MSRRKRNGRGDLAIDLTSLLDVIFIILMVVLCAQQQDDNGLKEKQLDAEKAVAEAEKTKQAYEDIIDNARYVWLASVSVPYDEEDVKSRTITVIDMSGEPVLFPMTGNDTQKPLDDLKNYLEKYIREYEENDCPVILSLNDDDENILYRDEKAVTELLLQLSAEHENVSVKGYLSEDG